jgi:hypothetical protein
MALPPERYCLRKQREAGERRKRGVAATSSTPTLANVDTISVGGSRSTAATFWIVGRRVSSEFFYDLRSIENCRRKF